MDLKQLPANTPGTDRGPLSRRRLVPIPAVLVAFVMLSGNSAALAQSQTEAGAGAGTSVKTLSPPRFRSLKSDKVNVRRGPGLQYPIAWVFRRIGMPVEVLREFEHWRQIRDSDGALGWVYRGLLAGRRTALLVPWQVSNGDVSTDTGDEDTEPVAIRNRADGASSVIAFAEPGTIANVRECDGRWCRVIVEPYEGWIEQAKLWGVYESERFKP